MSLRKLAHTPGLGCLFNYSARTAKSPTHPLWICSKTSPIVVRLLSQTWGASFDWRSGQGDYFWKFSCSLNTNINLKQAIFFCQHIFTIKFVSWKVQIKHIYRIIFHTCSLVSFLHYNTIVHRFFILPSWFTVLEILRKHWEHIIWHHSVT